MNTKHFLTLSLAVVAALLITATGCKKNEAEKPQLEIASPTENAVFTSGSTINITGTVSDEDELHEMSIKVMRHSDDSLIQEWYPTVHSMESYTFNETLVINVTTDTEFHVEVEVEDHDDDEEEEERHFRVVP